MTITDDDKNKAKDFAAQLQSMAVWLMSLASSTEPGEVGCESIDLGENNPDLRPEWWRELDEGEVIESGDVYKTFGRPGYTLCGGTVGDHYTPTPNSPGGWHETHYRLRPWRDMEEGEVIQDRDESVEPPKEPELRLPDGTDISNWPVIESGEMVCPGDAIRYKSGMWDVWELGLTEVKLADHAAGNRFRRRVLPCRHCGGEAYLSKAGHWYCVNCGCQSPNRDIKAILWNEQNRKAQEMEGAE